MKKLLLSNFLFLISYFSFSQNIGIGTNEPLNKLHVAGSFVVTAPTIVTNTAPTAPQTKTMVNASTIFFTGTDSTGRLYDPGGPAGNYNANITANASISGNGNSGIELTIESINLGTGDSLIIEDLNGWNVLLAVGNNYNTTGKYLFNSSTLYITFKSNSDGSVGSGFSLLYRKLYDNSATLSAVSGYSGTSFFFDTKTGAFRSGKLGNHPRGFFSTAFGQETIASGESSFAIGQNTIASGENAVAIGSSSQASAANSFAMAGGETGGSGSIAIGGGAYSGGALSFVQGTFSSSMGIYSFAHGYSVGADGDYATAFGGAAGADGDYSVAMGSAVSATGDYSVAMGQGTTASGSYSTAFGQGTVASGPWSTAFGHSTTASGLNATAMGINASTNNQSNSFCIGGTGTNTVCTSPNQFMTRFDNYTFWIGSSNYAYMIPGSNGWAYTSDRNRKERFEEMNGETVLKKISKIPFYSWSFNSPDTRQYRHYGIMAQDFYEAFGRDSYGTIGNDTTVSALDLIGVAYSAIKELEKRTTDQQEVNKQALKENDQLRADNLALQKRLNSLEAKLNELVAVKEKEESFKKSVAGNQ